MYLFRIINFVKSRLIDISLKILNTVDYDGHHFFKLLGEIENNGTVYKCVRQVCPQQLK